MVNTGKVVVVTGSNKGIGFYIVRALLEHFRKVDTLQRDGHPSSSSSTVYLTARDELRGKDAVKVLEQEGLTPKFHLLDVESLESVQTFAKFIKHVHGGVDILVNNAAISYFTNVKAPLIEQAERTLSVNYFGLLNVSKELFPLLRPNARVVNISSGLGHLSKINAKRPGAQLLRERFASDELTEESLTSLMHEYIKSVGDGEHKEAGWPNSAYAVSKIGVCALTRIQKRELEKSHPGQGIIINSVHPGWVKSDMTGGKGLYTPEEGAVAPTWAALLPLLATSDTPNGSFIWRDMTVVDWVNGPLPTTM